MANLKFKKWLNQLIGLFIKGGATSAGAVLGVAAGGIVSSVKPLDWQQFKYAFLGGAAVSALTFLQKNPVPGFEEGNTERITKEPNDTQT